MCYFTLAHLLSVNHIIGTTINLLKKYSQFNKKDNILKKVFFQKLCCGNRPTVVTFKIAYLFVFVVEEKVKFFKQTLHGRRLFRKCEVRACARLEEWPF